KAPEKQFNCSMRLAVPGPDLFAEDSERDLYAAIDLVTKKIEQQIRKRQSKYKARKHTEAARTKRRRQETGIEGERPSRLRFTFVRVNALTGPGQDTLLLCIGAPL